MNVFTDAYSALVALLQTKSLDATWATIEGDLKVLCDPAGPDSTKSTALETARDKINKAARVVDWISFNSERAYAEEILKAAQKGKADFQQRAAMLKTFKHFYCVQKRGNQSVWVLDHPKAYSQWAFDQLSGKSEPEVRSWLEKEEEVFGSSNRKMMSDSLQLARKWSLDVVALLGAADAPTLATVKRWFHSDTDTEQQVKATVTTLSDGFLKISNACNSTRIIFSDRPHLRASGTYDETFASVNAGDTMPVIYIYQLFLKTGKRSWFGVIPKLWLCALTVIHELSHKLVNTNDISYDYQGLKPGATISVTDAIKNADSWAYFAADLVGALDTATVTAVLK